MPSSQAAPLSADRAIRCTVPSSPPPGNGSGSAVQGSAATYSPTVAGAGRQLGAEQGQPDEPEGADAGRRELPAS